MGRAGNWQQAARRCPRQRAERAARRARDIAPGRVFWQTQSNTWHFEASAEEIIVLAMYRRDGEE